MSHKNGGRLVVRFAQVLKTIVCLAVVLGMVPKGMAQADDAPKPEFVSSARRLLTAPELQDAPDEWIMRSQQWVDYILKQYPPSIPDAPVRHAALIRMDDILHIESAPHKKVVQQFYQQRMEQAIQEIEHTQVTHGMRVWKLYSHGFFVRTRSVSFCFDIVPGGGDPAFALSNEQIRRLSVQSDAAFISHWHQDHANKEVARAFLAAGKPVVAPPNLWEDDAEFATKLTYAKRGTTAEPLKLAHKPVRLQVIAYPGHQGPTVQNNVYLVTTPEGLSVAQMGDQWATSLKDVDYNIFREIATHHIDILIPNVWTIHLPEIISMAKPRLVIPGHENEMGHVVAHREDYTQSYTRLYPVRTPYLIMGWGESFQYSRPDTSPKP